MESLQDLANLTNAVLASEVTLKNTTYWLLDFDSLTNLHKAERTLSQAGYYPIREKLSARKSRNLQLKIIIETPKVVLDITDYYGDIYKSNAVGVKDSQQKHTDSRFCKQTPDIVREVPEGFYYIKHPTNSPAECIVLYNIWGKLEKKVILRRDLLDTIIWLKEMELQNVDSHPIPKKKSSKVKSAHSSDDSWLEKAMV